MPIKIKHISIWFKRVVDDSSWREKIFSRLWIKENNPPSWLNSGHGLLRHLLDTDKPPDVPKHYDPGWSGPDEITQRDADVAATVIQWLGTQGGQKFLKECFQEMNKQTIERDCR